MRCTTSGMFWAGIFPEVGHNKYCGHVFKAGLEFGKIPKILGQSFYWFTILRLVIELVNWKPAHRLRSAALQCSMFKIRPVCQEMNHPEQLLNLLLWRRARSWSELVQRAILSWREPLRAWLMPCPWTSLRLTYRALFGSWGTPSNGGL
jgi:hypothetical protein